MAKLIKTENLDERLGLHHIVGERGCLVVCVVAAGGGEVRALQEEQLRDKRDLI